MYAIVPMATPVPVRRVSVPAPTQRYAEVGHCGVTCLEQDVFGLDVPMDSPLSCAYARASATCEATAAASSRGRDTVQHTCPHSRS